MKSQQSHSSLTCLPERRNSTATGHNQPSFSRRSSLVDCYGRKRRRSLVELPATALSWDDRQRLSLIYLDTTQQWSLAECSTLHSRSEEIDTSSLSCEVPRSHEPYKGPYQPLPHDGRQEEHNTIMFVSLTRRLWRTAMLSQLMAILFSSMTVYYIHLKEVHALEMPTTLNLGHYTFLCIVFLPCLSRRSQNKRVVSVVKCHGWWYLLVAVIDVEANYLLCTSLQLEIFTTMQLLSCAALPTAMVLSLLVLHAQYQAIHIVGLALGYTAIACLIWADILDGSLFIGGKDQLQDDLLYLSGIVLFSAVTVVEEWAVKACDPIEFLGMIGLFGSVISCVQMGILEGSKLLLGFSWSTWYEFVMIAGYCLIQSIYTTLGSYVIRDAGATSLHLSLITSHFYVNLIKSILLQQTKFHVGPTIYTAHFIVALLGILIFASKQLPTPVPLQASYTSVSVPFPGLETSEKKDSSIETTPLNNSMPTSDTSSSSRGNAWNS